MNSEQFATMVQNHQTTLDGFAMKFTRNEDDAKDLLQDTMIKAMRFSDRYETGTNLKGWLYTIMRNTFINDYRKTSRRQQLIDQCDDLSSAQLMVSSTVNRSETTFAMRDIELALQSLPARIREPFIHYFEGYKYQEIADETGLPLGTVKTYIHEARKRLQKKLIMHRDR